MASYYDEHSCEPLREGEQPNHLLHLARMLIDTGYAREWEMEFESVFAGQRKSPPASKKAVEELPIVKITGQQIAEKVSCPVCLAEYEAGETALEMPCKHIYHAKCLTPWLEKTNSCPFCRHELPTDDEQYEEFKKQKARQQQREFELESLHSSMYG